MFREAGLLRGRRESYREEAVFGWPPKLGAPREVGRRRICMDGRIRLLAGRLVQVVNRESFKPRLTGWPQRPSCCKCSKAHFSENKKNVDLLDVIC